MTWIPSAAALIVLTIFVIYYLTRKGRPREVTGVVLVAGALWIYHLGDLGMWAGWSYELFRRIASLGYYLEIPALLLLAYRCLPEGKRTRVIQVLSWILCVPWVVALVLLKSYPNNFLEPPNIPEGMDPGKHETLVMVLIAFFTLGVVFVVVNAFRAAKAREGAGKSLCKALGIATLVMLIAEFILFSIIDLAHYDPTYLFGLISLFWIGMVGSRARLLKAPSP